MGRNEFSSISWATSSLIDSVFVVIRFSFMRDHWLIVNLLSCATGERVLFRKISPCLYVECTHYFHSSTFRASTLIIPEPHSWQDCKWMHTQWKSIWKFYKRLKIKLPYVLTMSLLHVLKGLYIFLQKCLYTYGHCCSIQNSCETESS